MNGGRQTEAIEYIHVEPAQHCRAVVVQARQNEKQK
jgi:hypothetical protein